jgi:uncharacterized protein (UPF0332 family)
MAGTKQEYIDYRVSKSNEIFEDAKLLALNQRWNSCVNRLYYSAYYMVSAVLYKNGIQPDTHNGTKTQFNLHFIKSGILPLSLGKLYSNLFFWRQESDYADFVDFDGDTVLPLIDEVLGFNNTILRLIHQTNC